MLKHLALPALLLLSACSQNFSTSEDQGGGSETPLSCTSFDGQWARCSSDTSSSVKVILALSGNTVQESIENYASVDCSGPTTGTLSFSAALNLGPMGASTSLAGATDATLTPDIDVFGCGANQPAYTLLKASDDCQQFFAANTVPGCSPQERGNAFDPAPFLRIQ